MYNVYNIMRGVFKMKNILNENDRKILLNQIDEINLTYDIESSAITDNILYMFLYLSNFYNYVEIDETTIYSRYNIKKELLENALRKLIDKNVISFRTYNDKHTYLLNNAIFENIN